MSLSVAGLWGAWNIVVKGTLGVAASIVLASTTTVPELLRGLDRLRMPKVITGIMGFMIRYGEVITDELRRMKVARQSRGYDPRWIWQARAVAASAGALFIRSFERGERVHVAMLARGYTGTLPDTQIGIADDEGGWALRPRGPGGGRGRGRRRVGAVVSGVPVLDVEGLAYAYPDGRQVLFGVDLQVAEGERVAILGPNGAGKTTLVLHLNGTLTGGRGSVRVDGLAVEKANLREIRRRVGIVFQDPDDQLFMPTVGADVAFGPANLGLKGPELQAKVEHALKLVGMEDVADRPPHHLSFGQRRRVAAATVLAMDPSILVLDEPSSNLDPMARREFAEIVLDLGLTTLMVTHDLPYALELCPRAVILNGGVIVADGPTRELLADPDLMRANRLELPFGFALPSGN